MRTESRAGAAPRHRGRLPQLDGVRLVADGGLETDLIYHHGFELPHFASIALVADGELDVLRAYYRAYGEIAGAHGTGLLLEAPTWRANPGWGPALGYTPADLDRLNREAVSLLEEIRTEFDARLPAVVVSGCLGPRGDGYVVGDAMSPERARDHHAVQIESFRRSSADMVTAMTLTYEDEAIGVVRAAREAAMPVAVSFTVETDGRLPNGSSLPDAIRRVDEATGGPDYYMLNCAHPEHFAHVLDEGGQWRERIAGLRANASRMSHAELDEATQLDEGDPVELGEQHRDLAALLPSLTVMGGCCGTDHRHIAEVAAAWVA